MKNSQKAPLGQMIFKGAFIFNPVLVQLVGICPIVAAAASVSSALLLSAAFAVDMIVTCVIASAAMKDFPRYLRVALYLLFGLAIVCPMMYLLEETMQLSLPLGTSIYLPLMAINSVAAVHCEQFSVKNSVRDSFADALSVSIGYGVVFILTGAIREYLGSGTVAAHAVPLPFKLSGMLMPFGGLIVLAYLAVLLKWYISKYYPEYLGETIMKIQNTTFSARRDNAPKPAKVSPQELPVEVKTAIEPEPPAAAEPPASQPPVELEIVTELGAPAPAESPEPVKEEAIEEIEKLGREHEEFVGSSGASFDELLKSLESDIDKISANKQDNAGEDGKE